jgi:predicted NAD/FAD-binding protein
MNSLQGVSKKKDYFVSINDPGNIDPKKILWQKQYSHPIYHVKSMQAQAELPKLNVTGPIYFCGAYFKYGFHEDGLTSGLEVVRAITRKMPEGYKGWS